MTDGAWDIASAFFERESVPSHTELLEACGGDMALLGCVKDYVDNHFWFRGVHAPIPQGVSGDGVSAHAGHAKHLSFPGYEILEEIRPGIGGMGQVFKARQLSLDRIVVIKVPKRSFVSVEARELFRKEAQAAAGLRHPSIVPVFDYNEASDRPYYTMPFVEGQLLSDACKGRDPKYIATLIRQTAEALAYAHGQGVIHRDIKPSNILVDADHMPQITDFGLAERWEDTVSNARQTSTTAGTPMFIAPEVLSGPVVPNPLLDVYALGVTLYRVLTGVHPFPDVTQTQWHAAVLDGTPRLPRHTKPEIPEPLQRICLKAMERDPGERYQTAGDMADDIHRFIEGDEVRALPTRYRSDWWLRIPRKEWAGRFVRRNRMSITVAMALLIMAASGVTYGRVSAKLRREAEATARQQREDAALLATSFGPLAYHLLMNSEDLKAKALATRFLVESKDIFRPMFDPKSFMNSLAAALACQQIAQALLTNDGKLQLDVLRSPNVDNADQQTARKIMSYATTMENILSQMRQMPDLEKNLAEAGLDRETFEHVFSAESLLLTGGALLHLREYGQAASKLGQFRLGMQAWTPERDELKSAKYYDLFEGTTNLSHAYRLSGRHEEALQAARWALDSGDKLVDCDSSKKPLVCFKYILFDCLGMLDAEGKAKMAKYVQEAGLSEDVIGKARSLFKGEQKTDN